MKGSLQHDIGLFFRAAKAQAFVRVKKTRVLIDRYVREVLICWTPGKAIGVRTEVVVSVRTKYELKK